jgi:hypothetical protein
MKTTKKDFEKFKTSFIKWIKKLGLADIHFNFIHTEIESYAQVVGDHNQKCYVAMLSTHFDMDKLPKGFLNYLGYHEACECLLYRLRTVAMNREFNQNELDSEVHTVINRLERMLITEGCFFNIEGDVDL